MKSWIIIHQKWKIENSEFFREKSKNKQIHQKAKTENSEFLREKSKNKQIALPIS